MNRDQHFRAAFRAAFTPATIATALAIWALIFIAQGMLP